MKRYAIVLTAIGALSACNDPGDQAISQTDQLLREPSGVVDHGALVPDVAAPIELSAGATSHLFHLTLSADARVQLRTHALEGGNQVDTVLTLYRGSAPRNKPFARNDDDGASRFSSIERSLGAGEYVVEVSGFKRSTRGAFVLSALCSGAGCPAREPSCILGSAFYELRTNPALHIDSEVWVRSTDDLDALEREQLLIAVHQSSHTDVTTAEQALERVDQNEARWMEIVHTSSQRAFTVVEYGAGDNSYGAIFEAGTTNVAASIHDGDFLACTAF